MAFKDSFESALRTIGDKTSTAIEVGKIKSKISKEKSIIRSDYEKIGRIMYKRYKNGGFSDEELNCLFSDIEASRENIINYEEDIKRVKVED
ncbi:MULTISPECIES: hypothetical protein [Eubacterium]|jgi:hypothetical protein|uniref:Uncharacterized protein n=1 Tax=Eubacterium ruminantium TaxID=42322 RepID=A0A1T4NG68_9FIRM|nr:MULTISPECIES: hypothetical protein [Eubacterium]MCR5368903.1 hypothetical protein [Eubacterium sp.]SCW53484.1 hypothetical protein SAMN05660484_01574 [Eubacterium ruminantium]SDM87036.1 hypothetical protein SAMN04490370_10749 [Eubacterium ruminantium]SJZ78214.1 hypothetical protein SAMN02745110_01574 [Eubacterium ruminantium]